ncbi:MAG: FGGY family carbohydrate kinase [Anaerolineae bacterium]
MPTKPFLLGLDQGTSGSRALILDDQGQVHGYGYQPLPRIYPQAGWVEQDPLAVAATLAAAITEAIGRAGCHPAEIAACGIACQRNTDFAWHAASGQALAPAITWQDLRTLPLLDELRSWELFPQSRRRLGYSPGPYSSALHLAWRLRSDQTLIDAAAAGNLRLGLSAAWLLVALGQPAQHAMDFSLVQAMGLYDFRARQYWHAWLERLGVPEDPLPAAMPTVHEFGNLRVHAPDGASAAVPVLAMIGDQQAALFGYDCRRPGDAECTHGTASFVDVCLGNHAPDQEKINVYVAWALANGVDPDPAFTYCLEADTAVTGAAIRWMRENARLFDRDDEVGPLAASVPDAGGVVFVPAFTGLNVPYNDHRARGTILGLTLGSTRAHIVRAFLEALGYQVRAILETIQTETGLHVDRLHLGGGVSASDEACQIQADLIGIPTIRPHFTETTARAAAMLAGIGSGAWKSPDHLPPLPEGATRFEPRLTDDQRETGFARWQRAISRARAWDVED